MKYLAILLFMFSTTVYAADTDGDGIDDAIDNCTTQPNASQLDTDDDGFGNACDADYDNSGSTSGLDFGYFLMYFGKSVIGTGGMNADCDGSGTVTASDFGCFLRYFGTVPGPSGKAEFKYVLFPKGQCETSKIEIYKDAAPFSIYPKVNAEECFRVSTYEAAKFRVRCIDETNVRPSSDWVIGLDPVIGNLSQCVTRLN